MTHYLVTLKNKRQFGIVAHDIFEAIQTALEVIDEKYLLDDDKELEDICSIDFYHKNGRVM